MVGSERTNVSRLYPSHDNSVAFRIVLKQEEGFDIHDTREFYVALDTKFAIGRASKNMSKGYLLPAKHNVFIDSPVVSREHAILTVNASTGIPQVYITDTKSMHGTFVNGIQLVPDTPKQLSNGDKLQFGVSVNRGDSFYVAYKYAFTAELSKSEPFSRGFTVPEAESEEELDFVQSGCGSQLDPLVLDDSDAQSEQSEQSDGLDDNADVTLTQPKDEGIEIGNSSDEDEDEDEDEDSAVSIADSIAEIIVESDIDSDAANTRSIFGVQHEGMKGVKEVTATAAAEQLQITLTEPSYSSATPLASPGQIPLEPLSPASPVFYGGFGYPTIPDLPLPPLGMLSQNLERSSFDNAVAPPLPPRPWQKRQRMRNETPQKNHHEEWFGEEASNTPLYSFVEPKCTSREEPGNATQQMELPPICNFSPERKPTFEPTADHIQTPPPTLTVNVVDSTPLPPTRRTGVSITEIVDEQPPTPTSVRSRKRSAACAFEEQGQQPLLQKTSESEADAITQSTSKVAGLELAVPPPVEQATPQSQRPIARPRSIIRKALRAASLMLPATAFGAAVSVAALTALPESFFTVA